MNSLGIAAGLATAALWTATAVCFEASSRRLGSGAVNVLRLLFAALLFVALSLGRSGTVIPAQVSFAMWRDLVLSGLIGFVLGDAMLFEAFVLIGSRLSMLIYASVPAITAIAGYLFLGEVISGRALIGMGVTIAGITLAIMSNQRPDAGLSRMNRRRGIILAVGGSGGQAAGLLLGKRGSNGLDGFEATEIRVLAGLVGCLVLALATGKVGAIVAPLGSALRHPTTGDSEPHRAIVSERRALLILLGGAILGPFLGVSLGLTSAQLLPAGVASTLMSIVPALLVPVSACFFHESISYREIAGTGVTLAGVGIMAL